MWHSLGTCAMKLLNEGGVVDGELNVYGVEGLKVAGMFEFVLKTLETNIFRFVDRAKNGGS